MNVPSPPSTNDCRLSHPKYITIPMRCGGRQVVSQHESSTYAYMKKLCSSIWFIYGTSNITDIFSVINVGAKVIEMACMWTYVAHILIRRMHLHRRVLILSIFACSVQRCGLAVPESNMYSTLAENSCLWLEYLIEYKCLLVCGSIAQRSQNSKLFIIL